MKQLSIPLTAFRKAMNETGKNTVVFENCTVFNKYVSDDGKYTSVLNLCSQDNYILNEVIPYLKTVAKVEIFTEKQAEQYYGKPMKLSMYYYNVTDYWWILLAINNYFVSRDFVGWDRLLIPDRADLEKVIDKVLYANENIGKYV
jgi:hypothetical protein